jgi:hypothetical protein
MLFKHALLVSNIYFAPRAFSLLIRTLKTNHAVPTRNQAAIARLNHTDFTHFIVTTWSLPRKEQNYKTALKCH